MFHILHENVNEILIKLADNFIYNSRFIIDFNSKNVYNKNKIAILDRDNLNRKKNIKDCSYPKTNCISFIRSPLFLYNLMNKIREIEKDGFYIVDKINYYPVNGFCDWFKYLDNDDKYIYLLYSEETNRSFIRYLNNETNNIVTCYNKKGWNKYVIHSNKNIWHCIGSDTQCINIVFKKSDRHYLKNKMDKYDFFLNKKKPQTKTNDNFLNFLHGRHTCKSYNSDGLNWRVINKDSKLYLRDLDFIFMDNKYCVEEVLLNNISWKCKDNISLKKYEDVNLSEPIILVKTNINPHGLEYRAIDGSHRLSKLLSQKKQYAKAYIIEYSTFLKFMI
tara:strand:- start:426 stop:1424 length:999 start_codon:yes stop_codon:yes gene_type:complete